MQVGVPAWEGSPWTVDPGSLGFIRLRQGWGVTQPSSQRTGQGRSGAGSGTTFLGWSSVPSCAFPPSPPGTCVSSGGLHLTGCSRRPREEDPRSKPSLAIQGLSETLSPNLRCAGS